MIRTRNVYVSNSSVGGRGVFAARDLERGQVIERCPVLIGADMEAPILRDYKFYISDNRSAVALGYGSLYNHAQDPNASWKLRPKDRQMVFIARRPIPKGTEIFISYGNEWWDTRRDILEEKDPYRTSRRPVY